VIEIVSEGVAVTKNIVALVSTSSCVGSLFLPFGCGCTRTSTCPCTYSTKYSQGVRWTLMLCELVCVCVRSGWVLLLVVVSAEGIVWWTR
jgi:hypothetical protein